MNIGFPTGTFEPGIPNFHPQSGVNLIGFSKVCFYTGAKHPPPTFGFSNLWSRSRRDLDHRF